jgi:uncharacterized membrane protein YdjX (TVP38/TMEM64 family)
MSDSFDEYDDPYPASYGRIEDTSGGEDPGSRVWYLWLAAGATVVSGATFALGLGVAINLVGYVLASLVAFTLVALFRRNSVRRLVQHGVVTAQGTQLVGLLILVLGLVVAALHAYRIARHYG